MPKQRITKDMVVEAAFRLARQGGMDAVRVKAIAQELGCSVQPIYGYCENMEGLRREVTARAGAFLRDYLHSRIDPDDPFRSTGLAYAGFAREEPHLYRLYFLRQREGLHSFDDIYQAEADPRIAETIARQRNIPPEAAQALHRHMIIYSTGLSFMLSVLGADADPEQTAAQLEEAQNAFARFCAPEEENKCKKQA